MERITEEVWVEYLTGTLPEGQRAAIDKRIAEDPAVAAEWEEMEGTWQMMSAADAVPEPSTAMDEGFDAMLAGFQASQKPRKTWQERWQEIAGQWVVPKWAWGALLLLLGVGVGRWTVGSNTGEMQALTQEVQQMQQMMMLTLLEQPKPQDRMRAVSMTESLPSVDGTVIEGLLKVLRTDPNINVRLVAVEALARYSEYPKARMGLISSIADQDSPMIQVALAEAMLMLGAKDAVPAFQELLEKPELDTTVEGLLEETIQKLI